MHIEDAGRMWTAHVCKCPSTLSHVISPTSFSLTDGEEGDWDQPLPPRDDGRRGCRLLLLGETAGKAVQVGPWQIVPHTLVVNGGMINRWSASFSSFCVLVQVTELCLLVLSTCEMKQCCIKISSFIFVSQLLYPFHYPPSSTLPSSLSLPPLPSLCPLSSALPPSPYPHSVFKAVWVGEQGADLSCCCLQGPCQPGLPVQRLRPFPRYHDLWLG